MRGSLIVGSLQDGERVAIRKSSLRANATSEPESILNLSTGADVTRRNTTGASYLTVLNVVIFLVVVIIVILVVIANNHPRR